MIFNKLKFAEVLIIKLTIKNVSIKLKEYRDIKSLFATSFPKNEQMSMWLLLLLSKRKAIDFLAYYDKEDFCGISYTVCDKDIVFVLYLAVNDKIRSKGYGTIILEEIKNKYNGRPILLNIEPLDLNSINYEQRVKRFEFYKRNGLSDTGYYIQDVNNKYRILSTGKRFVLEEYCSALKKLSFGLYSPKIMKGAE